MFMNLTGEGGRLKGMLVCNANVIALGGWAFIEAGVFIMAFTVSLGDRLICEVAFGHLSTGLYMASWVRQRRPKT